MENVTVDDLVEAVVEHRQRVEDLLAEIERRTHEDAERLVHEYEVACNHPNALAH
jgi:hypothetical protein